MIFDFNWRRFLKRLAFVVVALLAILLSAPPVVLTLKTLQPPRFALRNTAATLPFAAEDVAFQTRDGLTMRGWLGKATPDDPVIILCHGYPANREQMIPYATMLQAAGYNVLLFDYRAWGTSDGQWTTFGLKENEDMSAAMDYLSKHPSLRRPRFGALGLSMGAGMVLLAAAHDHRIEAVVPDSVYPVIEPMFTQWNQVGLTIWPYRMPFIPLAKPTANLILEGRMGELDPLAQAAKVSPSALFLVHSRNDGNGLTPPAGAQQIYDKAKEPKEIWFAPQGNHVGALSANEAEYKARVVGFFDRRLRGAR